MHVSIPLLTLAATLIFPALASRSSKVLLTSVSTLTLRQGQKTTARRVSAIPQLKCVGGDAKGLYEVDVMRCRNEGSDYDDNNVQWTCTASLPAEYKLGLTDVQCEGYDSPEDPYILTGSCGVSYRLMLTDIGRKKHGKSSYFGGSKSTSDGWTRALYWTAVLTVVSWVAYSVYTDPLRQTFRREPRTAGDNGGDSWGGGGGGGGDGGPPHDNPPPYSRYPGKPRAPRTTAPRTQEQWRPGFWSGAATGAAAGYAASSMRGSGSRQQAPAPSGGGWFSRRGGNGNGESSSSSSATHESTGFGSTSRR